MTRYSREKRVDSLLCAAKHWQNGKRRQKCCWDGRWFTDPTEEMFGTDDGLWDSWASAALSEVEHAMEIEIVDAETGE
jgi:hypothetical protein